MAPAAVLAVAADIACAMVALHGAGIVHGDLSGGALPRRDDAGLRQRQLANPTAPVPDPTPRMQATCCWRRTRSAAPAAACARWWATLALARHLGGAESLQSNTYGTVDHQAPEVLRDGRIAKVGAPLSPLWVCRAMLSLGYTIEVLVSRQYGHKSM